MYERTRVKICGITRAEDALTAVEAGADAIGLVFYPGSKRAVDTIRAREIVHGLPPFVSRVGLFVNERRDYIESVIEEVGLDLIQFHGDESPSECQGYSRPYIKALRVYSGLDIETISASYREASGILLDTHVSGVAGGTGRVFDWGLVPGAMKSPLILAGGLNPANVYDAIQKVHPYAVDVSGGVESGPGIKDHDKVYAFIKAVRTSI